MAKKKHKHKHKREVDGNHKIYNQVEAEENLVIDFQYRMQDLIIEQGLGLDKLSERTGLTKKKLRNLQKAEGEPTLRQVAAIYLAFGCKCILQDVKMEKSKK